MFCLVPLGTWREAGLSDAPHAHLRSIVVIQTDRRRVVCRLCPAVTVPTILCYEPEVRDAA